MFELYFQHIRNCEQSQNAALERKNHLKLEFRHQVAKIFPSLSNYQSFGGNYVLLRQKTQLI